MSLSLFLFLSLSRVPYSSNGILSWMQLGCTQRLMEWKMMKFRRDHCRFPCPPPPAWKPQNIPDYGDLYLDAKRVHKSILSICTTSCHNLNLKRNSYLSIDGPARDTFSFPQLVYRYPSFFPSPPLFPFPSTLSSLLLRIPLRWKGNKLRNEASPYTFIHHHVFPFPLLFFSYF